MIDNRVTFESFARKAAAKIEAHKKTKTKVMYVGDIDENIVIRGLSSQEIVECSEFSDSDLENDLYTLYYASKTLQDAAADLVSSGVIKRHHEICEMFSATDRRALINAILDLSGINDPCSVSEVDEVKNSCVVPNQDTILGTT